MMQKRIEEEEQKQEGKERLVLKLVTVNPRALPVLLMCLH
jgi:hypothetical protein